MVANISDRYFSSRRKSRSARLVSVDGACHPREEHERVMVATFCGFLRFDVKDVRSGSTGAVSVSGAGSAGAVDDERIVGSVGRGRVRKQRSDNEPNARLNQRLDGQLMLRC